MGILIVVCGSQAGMNLDLDQSSPDCVLVVDDDEGLSGIFTAKDLAYRVCLFDWLKAITVPALKLS